MTSLRLLSAALIPALGAAAQLTPLVVISHVSIIDVAGGLPEPDMTVVIEGDGIVTVDKSERTYPADEAKRLSLPFARHVPTFAKTEAGRIGVRQKADLVLLDANPIDDIRNTQRIRAVILNGRVFDRTGLDLLLAQAATLAKER